LSHSTQQKNGEFKTQEKIYFSVEKNKCCGSGCLWGLLDPDPYFLGPPGSGSGFVSTRYGSGSGSFYHQAKIVGFLLFWDFFDFLSLKNGANVASKSTKTVKKYNFLLPS
jgi:hypothetical protein